MTETLRIGRTTDAQAIAVMSRDLIEAGLGWTYTPEHVLRHLRAKDCLTVVAEDAGAVVGFAIAQYSTELAHLTLLGVDPARRRQGLGKRLLAWHIECCKTAQVHALRLELRAENVVAHTFYRTLGFVEVGVTAGYYAGLETGIRMELTIRKSNQ